MLCFVIIDGIVCHLGIKGLINEIVRVGYLPRCGGTARLYCTYWNEEAEWKSF